MDGSIAGGTTPCEPGSGGRVVQLDPDTNGRVSTMRLRGNITDLALADGTIWASDFDHSKVIRLTPSPS
jgi:hypothetical protein